jgi:hypothetical protein
VKWLVAALGLAWALGNLGVAYLFFTSGVAAKNVHKGLGVQASLVIAAVFVAVFALLLLAQAVSLARARLPD